MLAVQLDDGWAAVRAVGAMAIARSRARPGPPPRPRLGQHSERRANRTSPTSAPICAASARARCATRALLSGLLIAAASAAGLNAAAAPVVRTGSDGGVSAILLLDPCHLSVHSLPDRGLALVDVLARDAAHADQGARRVRAPARAREREQRDADARLDAHAASRWSSC